jgi:hypothetical protein
VVERPLLKGKADLFEVVDAVNALGARPAVWKLCQQAVAERDANRQADYANRDAKCFKRQRHLTVAEPADRTLVMVLLPFGACGNEFRASTLARTC